MCYVEIEAFAFANLVAKIERGFLDAAPIWSNLKTFEWSRFRGKVDLVSGGFPCQPFSCAGRKQGDEDPRHLWPHIRKGIEQLERPPLVFLENVEGIISSKLKGGGWRDPENTPVLLHILRELERLDYRATAGVFSAREVGAPHQRKRVFILACRSDLRESGRALVSGMLERGRGRDVAHAATQNGGRGYSEDAGPCEEMGGSSKNAVVPPHSSITSYPAPRGADQLGWEPPRVTEVKSPMGRDLNGAPGGLDYAECARSLDSRTDELRLLGNGVVPDTAARAFCTLWHTLQSEV